MIGKSNDDETNSPHKLLLTDTQVSRFCKAFGNGLSANIKLSKTQMSKMVGGCFIPDLFDLLGLFPPLKVIRSIANSYKKGLF